MAFWGEFGKSLGRAVVLGEKEVSKKDPSSETQISANYLFAPKQTGLSLLILYKSPGSSLHISGRPLACP